MRDNIYPCLTQSKIYFWKWTDNKMIQKTGQYVKIEVECAPMLSIMTTHPKIKEEHLESAAFRNVLITLRIEEPTPGYQELPVGDLHVVKHATLILTDHAHELCGPVFSYDMWKHLQVLAQWLTRVAPNVPTFRLAFHTPRNATIAEVRRDPGRKFVPGDIEPFLPTPPSSLGCMRIAQIVHTYHIVYKEGDASEGAYYHEIILVCFMLRIGMYVFTKDTNAIENLFWSESQVGEVYKLEAREAAGTSNERKAKASKIEQYRWINKRWK